MTQVSFHNVSKSFGDTCVIQSLDLAVASGEFLVIVGPSGCGKSTVLRLLSGLEPPTSGDICFNGDSVLAVSPKDRDVAMVFQNYALYPHMSVFDNMGFALKMRGVSKVDIARHVNEAAQMLGLENLLSRKPKELSGGQRQRVALGRAIVRKPNVFLMDEPLSNLDAKLRVSMRQEIRALHQRLGVTTLYVTHDQAEAMTMGDRIAVLNAGVLQQCGSPEEIYKRPANPFVARFMAPITWLTLTQQVFSDTADILGTSIQVPQFAQNRPVRLGFRPEAVTAAYPSEAESGLVVAVEVTHVEYLGNEVRCRGVNKGSGLQGETVEWVHPWSLPMPQVGNITEIFVPASALLWVEDSPIAVPVS